MGMKLSKELEREILSRAGLSEIPATTKAKGRTSHTPGRMNKTESQYANELALRVMTGEVRVYRFEAIKLRLANATFYSPDFLVILADWTIELHEVKGHWEDDARVKWKVAAEQFPEFTFVAVARTKGGWKKERYGA